MPSWSETTNKTPKCETEHLSESVLRARMAQLMLLDSVVLVTEISNFDHLC